MFSNMRSADVQLGVACMQNQDVVQLQVGYHVLEGKRMPLKKPMAIMDKVQETDEEGNTQTVCKVRKPAGGLQLIRLQPHACRRRAVG
jgi:hypothetical protein